ncbi:unnamed protein product [Cuscuta europaea]|uniref:Thylakoid membrane protein TERC, chloroplastic n=1 Tax=Cuscuta europaea TaxID=41803 RepID=A0A9P0Z9B5_CUSEU|nr:unnamed protein product [Cuscuta europaea]
MKLASIIHHNSLRASPLAFTNGSFRNYPVYPIHPNSIRHRAQFAHSYSPTPLLAGSERRCNSRILCSRKTEQGEQLSTSGKDMSHQQSVDSVNHDGSENHLSSVRTVALCVLSAVVFGAGLGYMGGAEKAYEFFAGYILEQSLSVDNLFVFILIFKYFEVPLMYQNRVLSYGIAGAIIFRLSIILLGTATLQKFEAVNLPLAGLLLYSSFKLFAEEDGDTDLSENFIVKTCQRFIPITSKYDGDRFITVQDGIWKASHILDRLHLYSLQWP